VTTGWDGKKEEKTKKEVASDLFGPISLFNCSVRGLDQVCIYVLLCSLQRFLVSGYLGVEDSSCLIKEIFSFLEGTNLVPVEIE